MLTDEQGRAKCVACGLCPQICPANCIKLVPGEDEEGQPLPADLRDRRIPLHLLRLLPGSLPGGSDSRRACTTRTPNTAARRFVYDLERLMRADAPGLECGIPPTRRASRRCSILDDPLSTGPSPCSPWSAAGAVRHAAEPASRRRCGWSTTMFALAALYVMLDAQFIGVHAGAGVRRRHHGGVPVRHHAAEPRAPPGPTDLRGLIGAERRRGARGWGCWSQLLRAARARRRRT